MIFTFFSHHYVILLCFLVVMGFLSGFVDAVAGGGGLISLPALLYTGIPITCVIGTSKLQSAFGMGVAVYKYYKDGLINFLTVYRGLIAGFIGAMIGSISINYISNHFLQIALPFLMLGVFIFNIFNRSMGITPGKKRLNEVMFFTVFGFILGFYDAFFGPGTGNFWIVAIVFFLGYTFLNASGYAKVLNLKSCLFSLVVFLYYHEVNFLFGFIMAIGQFFGGYFGAKTVISRGSKFVRPFFMVVVFINILLAFYQLIFDHNSLIG